MAKKVVKEEVAVVPAAELALEGMDFLGDSTTNNISADECTIPRLNILQKTNGETNKRDDKYIEGAESGMFFDNLSKQVYDGGEGVLVIPVCFKVKYLEWWPRLSTQGKGFVADHGDNASILDSTTKNDKGHDMTENGTQIVKTNEYYILLETTEGFKPFVISMKSTGLRPSKIWNSLISTAKRLVPGSTDQMFNPAMYFISYRLKSVFESNDHGDWFNWSVSTDVDTLSLDGGVELYNEAKKIADSINTGEVKAAAQSEEM
jgi:hypothetical protein